MFFWSQSRQQYCTNGRNDLTRAFFFFFNIQFFRRKIEFSAALSKFKREGSVAKLLAVELLREGQRYFGSGRRTEAIPLADDYRAWHGGPFCVFSCIFDWTETASEGGSHRRGFAVHSSIPRRKEKKHSMTCAAHALFASWRSRVGSRHDAFCPTWTCAKAL